MPRDGSKTRNRILEETTQLVLENGFAATTIDLILDRTRITKGAFFYHFKSKSDLAYNLMQNFARQDMALLEQVLADTEHLSDSPRRRLLEFVQWFVDAFSGLEKPHEGCLYASYLYEPEQFDQEVKDMVSEAILNWRKGLGEIIAAAIRECEVKPEIHVDSLADMLTVILEGAFITAKALNDVELTALQLKHYRNYLELLLYQK